MVRLVYKNKKQSPKKQEFPGINFVCRVNKQVQNYFNNLKNSIFGEEKFSFSRGRRLILA